MSSSLDELADLAVKLKTAHRKTRKEIIQCGEWLIRSKEICLHSEPPIEWIKWLKEGTGISRQMAWWYMRAAKKLLQEESGMEDILHEEQNGPFYLDEEAHSIYRWLCECRESWPESFRPQFIEIVRTQLRRMEVGDDVIRRQTASQARAREDSLDECDSDVA